MATFGPDLPPRSGHHELQVLDVHYAQRAQRRLAQHAASARVREMGRPVELEDACLEAPDPPDVISSDEEIAVVATSSQRIPSERARSRSPPREVVELDSPDEEVGLPSFYVHTFEYGDMARCCSSCREFFLPGQLRLGLLLESADEAIWMHAPRCLRRGNFEVSLLESVAFDRDLSDQVRARVLEELAAINARINEARWPGQARVAAQNTKPWHCDIQRLDDQLEPASSVAWSMVRVPLPVVNSTRASRPGLAARAARSALHVALEARWAAIDAQLQQAEEMREIPDSLSQPRNENLDSLEELLSSVPCHKLEGAAAQALHEPCAVCYEDMVLGEEVRRLPCLHYFHRACIDRWLKVKATCPLDNLNIRELIAKQSA